MFRAARRAFIVASLCRGCGMMVTTLALDMLVPEERLAPAASPSRGEHKSRGVTAVEGCFRVTARLAVWVLIGVQSRGRCGVGVRLVTERRSKGWMRRAWRTRRHCFPVSALATRDSEVESVSVEALWKSFCSWPRYLANVSTCAPTSDIAYLLGLTPHVRHDRTSSDASLTWDGQVLFLNRLLPVLHRCGPCIPNKAASPGTIRF
jgi:hypothetical protein